MLAYAAAQPFITAMRRQAALRERAHDDNPHISSSRVETATAKTSTNNMPAGSSDAQISESDEAKPTAPVVELEHGVVHASMPPPQVASDHAKGNQQSAPHDCVLSAGCDRASDVVTPACARAGSAGAAGIVSSFAKDSNRLSLGRRENSTGLPFPVDQSPDDIQLVAAGGHNIVVDSTGVAWTWGRNDSAGGGGFGSSPVSDSGQLGLSRKPETSSRVPAPLLTAARFVAADCGRYHSAAISTDGKLHTWGLNDFGQLGRPAADAQGAACDSGASCRDASEERALGSDSNFDNEELVAVAAGRYHTVVAAASGVVYTTGLNFCGNAQVCAERCNC